MTKLRIKLTDVLEDDFFNDGIVNLSSAYSNWQSMDGQGTKQLWAVLGKVYELGTQIEGNSSANTNLH